MQKLQLNKRYKSGSALEIIRDAILAGDISGEISQNEFAHSLEVSRIPETVKSLPAEKLGWLASAENPADFHRYLYENTALSLRRIFLRIITETYIIFTLEHSDGSKIFPAFENLKNSVKTFAELKANYSVYADSLADELMPEL